MHENEWFGLCYGQKIRIEALEECVASYRNTCDIIRQKRDTAWEDLNRETKKNKESAKLIEEMRKTIDSLSGKLSAATKKNDELTKRNLELEKRASALSASVDELRAESRSKDAIIADKNARIEDAGSKLMATRVAHQVRGEMIDHCRAAIKEIRPSHDLLKEVDSDDNSGEKVDVLTLVENKKIAQFMKALKERMEKQSAS